MKRKTISIFTILAMLTSIPAMAFAETCEPETITEIEYFEDGSYIKTEVTFESQQTVYSAEAKQTYYNKNNKAA